MSDSEINASLERILLLHSKRQIDDFKAIQLIKSLFPTEQPRVNLTENTKAD